MLLVHCIKNKEGGSLPIGIPLKSHAFCNRSSPLFCQLGLSRSLAVPTVASRGMSRDNDPDAELSTRLQNRFRIGSLVKAMIFLLSWMLLGQAQAAGYYRSDGDLEELSAILTTRFHVDKPAFTQGYVVGAADATAGISWCPTPQTSEDQIYHAVAKFMRDHPEVMNRSAAAGVSAALKTEFPCGKK